MQTADVNHEDFMGKNQNEMDKGLLVKFFFKPKLDQASTNKAGRPIYRDQEYIDIKIPGDRTGGACRPARQRDIERFPAHYRAFKNRVDGEEETEGTPLAEWPMMRRSKVEEMAFYNVRTVEQLANMSDAHVAQFMGGNNMKMEAAAWLKRAAMDADKAVFASELQKRDDKIDALQAQMQEFMEDNSEKPKAKRKSRAKKKLAPPPEIEESDDVGDPTIDS